MYFVGKFDKREEKDQATFPAPYCASVLEIIQGQYFYF
jgi:hypothetical protein